ncbi:RNA-guided endonuclease TnpB family protein [cf. Phormidesmis sp. LEGE 11477]|uniref:RNA-guided endonuclease InsQ/TnpB family protein n=1 Tax=cf. Phormidesmis sp. LEGE 11477 TaxID=1828680 RepID=UPI00187EAD8E|nr:RNA-guided endonuclease TnpB family protein [cf. Phormidesmis sp. LEGE 11477]MBE9062678.1 transposase [cf. Phormidesmis sp. LEGE 11477]
MLNMTWEFKLEPSAEQVSEIERTLSVCRKVWNYALCERKDWLNSRKCPVNACSLRSEYILSADCPFPGYHRQAKALTAAKKEIHELRSVNAQMLQQVLRKLDIAWERWRLKRSGLPRFKNQTRMRGFAFPQMLKNCISEMGLKLPQLGWLKVRWSREIPDLFTVKQARIVHKASGYFVMLSLEADVDLPAVPYHGHSLGVDVGLEYFLSTSDGLQVKRPRFLDALSRKLKLLQRRLKKKTKGSKNWLKLQKKIARVHQRIADTRKDWHFKLAHRLCDQASSIFVEDLDFRIMAKGFLGKHTLDAGLGQFTNQILPWVCFKRDVYYGQVNAYGTSQECPDCGADVKKDLSVRVSHCRACGSIKPRDTAAAQVICTRGQRGMENACGAEVAGAAVTSFSQLALKQEIFRAI